MSDPTKVPPKAPAKAAAKRASAKPEGAEAAVAADGFGPCIPEGYEPVGEVVELSRSDTVRVVADDVRVWKEAL